MNDKVFLILVDPDNKGTQSNKYYNMTKDGDCFTVEYGRVGQNPTRRNYPLRKWESVYRSKIRKGYEDVTHLKIESVSVVEDSSNEDFNKFYKHFKQYAGDFVSKTYVVNSCTEQQIAEAQKLINFLSRKRISQTEFNKVLVQLYKVIPRKMGNVRDNLIDDRGEMGSFISREQDALDAMDSSNISNATNPFKTLNIGFKEIPTPPSLQKQINKTNSTRYKIHKVFEIEDLNRKDVFESWVRRQTNKNTEFLFHGTRNPNIFSILKSGLLVRPSNAVSFAGSAYGDGIYHSAHVTKSMGYTGNNSDKIFFVQEVHMGNPYQYDGWYMQGKDIDRSEMNYDDLSKKGFDSLYVAANDNRLQNSEYIVYRNEQTITRYLIWFK